MSIYNYPQYYDIAFGYRDLDLECDFIEKQIAVHSRSNSFSLLDIACGTGSHLIEMGKRGFEVSGFDISPKMIEYAKKKAEANGINATLWVDNMVSFSGEKKYGCAINLLTGFNYLLRNEDVEEHLKRVASALHTGGLYIIEMNHPREFITNEPSTTNSWVETEGSIEVEVEWDNERSKVDLITHIVSTKPLIKVRDDGRELTIKMEEKFRVFLYQEILHFIHCSEHFELVNAFGSFRFDKPLDNSKDSWRMILVLRKK